MSEELLTPEEVEALHSIADFANRMARVIGHGPTRDADSREAIFHIHALQNMVMSQAAARRYPDRFRLLGMVIPEVDPPLLFRCLLWSGGLRCVLKDGNEGDHQWHRSFPQNPKDYMPHG